MRAHNAVRLTTRIVIQPECVRLQAPPLVRAWCPSIPRSIDEATIDIALPLGAVDLCREHPTLCRVLLSGYPSADVPLGYFVSPEQWKEHGRSGRFTKYHVALHRPKASLEEIDRVKAEIERLKGFVPRFPGTTAAQSAHSLGVVGETQDSVSYGAVIAMPHLTATPAAARLVGVHSLVAIKGAVLSLYSFAHVKRPEQIDQLLVVADQWLSCIRQANLK